LYSSSDHGNDDDDDDDNDTNTHALRRHFCSKRGGCEFPFSFDGNEGDSDSCDDDDDEPDDDNDDDDDDDNDNDNNNDNNNDNLDNVSKATLSSFASSGDSSSSAPSTVGGNDLHLAIPTSNPVQPSSNRNAFGSSDPLQQHFSSSDLSSLIGLHHDPERNARTKAISYEIGDDSSDDGNAQPLPVPTKVPMSMPVTPVSQCPTR
jgi:hypothetical protein